MKLLISPGYGAGWSTWNRPELATDKDLIELFEKGCTSEEMEKLCIEKNYVDEYGDPPYMGGFGQLEVVEAPKYVRFKIKEYDGFERIEILDLSDWIVAEE